MDKIKMVICVRTDLKMSPGKVAAQVAHGAIEAYDIARSNRPLWVKTWKESGSTKICLKLLDGEHLLHIATTAAIGLPTAVITDAGRTEIPSGTATVVAIGPAPALLIDAITGSLKLYG